MGRLFNPRQPQASSAIPVLPQEIVNLVIDEVASSLQSSTEPRRAALSTLKACTLVSHSFRQQARKHLFSQVHVRIDKHGHQHNGRIQSLGMAESDGVVHFFRTLIFTVDLPFRKKSFVNLPFSGTGAIKPKTSRWSVLRFVDVFRLRGTDAANTIAALNTACLHTLEIVGRQSFYVWDCNGKIGHGLGDICAKETLRSLRISKVVALPSSILKDAIQSTHLYNLTLSQISIANIQSDHPDSSYGQGTSSGRVSHLGQLEATGFSCSALLNILKCDGHASTPRYVTFPYLRKLAISVPTLPSEMDELWSFLQHISQTLECLELQQYKWSMYDALSQGSFRLSDLSSLCSLKICTTSFDIGKNFCTKQEMIAKLLGSDTAANTLTVKHIRRDSNLTWRDLGPLSGWEAIDTALFTSAFPNLKEFIFNLKLFYYIKDTDSSSPQSRQTS
ncbi:hypothetical protein JR316_0005177 [Psilocybe cubensis]|uniref:Uncharacterized protein n=1 Tax=Psilocybe cubensis TaxID=181762 RepID=A0ACB8H604_PSICU|nr:hypothetical protein JR316_0005177 [Psilocybe cubensis]KAH9483077.1 hypothetical protein JR316_0005177 [Psilocybe cubensis]